MNNLKLQWINSWVSVLIQCHQDWTSTFFTDAMSTLGGPEFRLVTAVEAGLYLSPVGKDNLFFAELTEDLLSGVSMLSLEKLWNRDLALADSVGAM